ncbi:hypothetical protein RDI58_029917 [Solanum bulbocastanum]|uniref:Uncharacterized protein n=1 Tax=Solanum bulbocastanum TaxID=147425 RepID=A0AAN8SSI5_SOLBU
MGSSDERAVLQLEDENLVRLGHFDRKTSSLGTAPQRSSYDLEADDDTILVDELTDQHGWTFILSLLGIIPLAERLGWATE